MNCTGYLDELGVDDDTHIHKVELVENFPENPTNKIKALNNSSVFEGSIYWPHIETGSLDMFYKKCLKIYKDTIQEYMRDLEHDLGVKGIASEDLNVFSGEASLEALTKRLYQQLEGTANINKVYVEVSYPVENSAKFIFVVRNTQITYGLLVYLHILAYQLMYFIEENIDREIPELYSDLINQRGRFRIGGYNIDDLMYNGLGKLLVGDDYVYVDLDCDS
jgi:hypothetical protein